MTSQRQEIQRSAAELVKSGRMDGDACARIVDALKKVADADQRAMPRVQRDSGRALLEVPGVTLGERARAAGIEVSTAREVMPAALARKKLHPMA